MKRNCILLFLLVFWFQGFHAQELRLRKGIILDNLPLEDSIGSRLNLFLPSYFESPGKWPLLFLIPNDEDDTKTLRYFAEAAESNGYILASSQALNDSISLTQKVLYVAESLKKLDQLLPLDHQRTYAGGLGVGAELANLLPSMLKGVSGVFSVASGPPNGDLISSRKTFHFVSVLNRADHHYPLMLDGEELMDQRGVANHILYFEGDDIHPDQDLLDRGMRLLTLMGMSGGQIARDSSFIGKEYQSWLGYTASLMEKGHFLLAYDQMEEGLAVFEDLIETDALKDLQRSLRRTKGYKAQKREANTLYFKESVIRQDYAFYMEEDVLSFNLDNLGWWRHQMGKIDTYKESWKVEEQLLGRRLQGFVNALIDDYVAIAQKAEPTDDDALILLNMLRTITQPDSSDAYLTVISLTSKYGDYGTALFYLEELLKSGYSDKPALYALDHTALLRISPEFNALIQEYLDDSRYQVPEPPDKGPN